MGIKSIRLNYNFAVKFEHMQKLMPFLFILMLIGDIEFVNAKGVGAEIYAGYRFYNFGDRSLRKSMKSLEDYWSTRGEPDIKASGYKFAYDFNYGINYISHSTNSKKTKLLGLEHYKFHNSCKVQYIYGERYFDMITRGGNFFAGQRNAKGIGLKLGVGFFNSVLESYFKYPSGVISYGKDKNMNGVYGTTYGGNVMIEVSKQFLFLKHIGLEAGLFFNTSGFSTEFYDPSYAKGINTAVNYSWIPEDFDGFYQAVNSGGVYEGKNIKSNSNSLGISVKASYLFNLKKNSHK